MSHTRHEDVPALRIDADNEWAWCGERRLPLTPRAFAVLRYLVEHPQRLITKDDLLATVWRDTVVSDAALSSCIRDLRKALGDSLRRATLHRDGASAGISVHRARGRAASFRRGSSQTSADRRNGTESPSQRPRHWSAETAELARLHARLSGRAPGSGNSCS